MIVKLLKICSIGILFGILRSKIYLKTVSALKRRLLVHERMAFITVGLFILIADWAFIQYLVPDGSWLDAVFFAICVEFGRSLQPIGLTGGIACGKSTVCKFLLNDDSQQQQDKHGTVVLKCPKKTVAIIDVDAIAHSILLPNGAAYERVVREFHSENSSIFYDSDEHGNTVLLPAERGNNDNSSTKKLCPVINRAKLGEKIFANPQKRRLLNKITHPIIIREMFWNIIVYKFWHRYDVVVVDIPLLFEGKLIQVFGTVVVVACHPETQLKRLRLRNPGLSQEECLNRIESQIPIHQKVKQADIVIQNDNDVKLEELEDEVLRVKVFMKTTNGYMFWSLVICLFVQHSASRMRF